MTPIHNCNYRSKFLIKRKIYLPTSANKSFPSGG